jgi:hypothetical protein
MMGLINSNLSIEVLENMKVTALLYNPLTMFDPFHLMNFDDFKKDYYNPFVKQIDEIIERKILKQMNE